MQNLNAEIPRPVPAEKAEAIENAENFEQELSFEQTEKIMAKVCDIGKKNQAYSVLDIIGEDINYISLEEVLQNGILGRINGDLRDEYKSELATSPYKDVWAQASLDYAQRKQSLLKNPLKNQDYLQKNYSKYKGVDKKNSKVDFNITGREYNPKRNFSAGKNKLDNLPDIYSSHWLYGLSSRVAILFDLSNFEEVRKTADIEEKTFHKYYNNTNKYLGESSEGEFGFSLHTRVAPRLFKGIIFQIKDRIPDEFFNQKTEEKLRAAIKDWDTLEEGIKAQYRYREVKTPEHLRYKFNDNPANWKDTAERIADLVKNAFREKPDLMIPIYDTKGNLLWPKQMSYDEVKKFVAERDAKNTKKEEK